MMHRLLLAVMAAVILIGATAYAFSPTIPRCAEDAVLIGHGDYVDGGWSGYICGPAVDNFSL